MISQGETNINGKSEKGIHELMAGVVYTAKKQPCQNVLGKLGLNEVAANPGI